MSIDHKALFAKDEDEARRMIAAKRLWDRAGDVRLEMLELLRRLSIMSFNDELVVMDIGCSLCGGNGYHFTHCELGALLKRIDGE